MEGRVLDDVDFDGEANMAADRELASRADKEGSAWLRVYGWKPATLSLGRFQNEEEVPESLAFLSRVKRETGGGAILHHHDLTYAIAFPTSQAKGQLRTLYCVAHHAFRSWLEDQGVSFPQKEGCEEGMLGDPKGRPTQAAPFLCFDRRAEMDLTLKGMKVLGSAQKRQGNCILQHGSLLWRRSEHAPHLMGVCDLVPGVLQFPGMGSPGRKMLMERLKESLAEAFGIRWREG